MISNKQKSYIWFLIKNNLEDEVISNYYQSLKGDDKNPCGARQSNGFWTTEREGIFYNTIHNLSSKDASQIITILKSKQKSSYQQAIKLINN